jgi:hypothetical protein
LIEAMNAHSHAMVRAQQRGIPPLILEWLDEFGEELYDGHGGVRRFFTKRSVRALERAFGREPVRRLSNYFDIYKVDSSHDGSLITTGHLRKRINRR